MNDHVERMVHNWFERRQSDIDSTHTDTALAEGQAGPQSNQALEELVTAIHRMLREAENDTRRRCEEIAIESAGDEVGGRVALAIRTATAESLPRKSLIEIRAPDLRS